MQTSFSVGCSKFSQEECVSIRDMSHHSVITTLTEEVGMLSYPAFDLGAIVASEVTDGPVDRYRRH